jgi:hypothetical protein
MLRRLLEADKSFRQMTVSQRVNFTVEALKGLSIKKTLLISLGFFILLGLVLPNHPVEPSKTITEAQKEELVEMAKRFDQKKTETQQLMEILPSEEEYSAGKRADKEALEAWEENRVASD